MSRKPPTPVEALGISFEVELYEQTLRSEPENVLVLAALAHALTEAGRFEEGLAFDMELARRVPHEGHIWYNLACSLALVGRLDDAIQALLASRAFGYDDFDHLLKDADLTAVRRHPHFGLIRSAFEDAAWVPGAKLLAWSDALIDDGRGIPKARRKRRPKPETPPDAPD